MPSSWLSDSQKIGVAFCSGGVFFFIGGILLFFDRAMLAMGNILFIIGVTILIGLRKTLYFFSRKQKLKGTIAFTAGIFLILMRWAFIGFFIESYGIFVLFGDFIGSILRFLRNVPVIGSLVAVIMDKFGVGGGELLPV